MKPLLMSILALALGVAALIGRVPTAAAGLGPTRGVPGTHTQLTLLCEGRSTTGSVEVRNMADDTLVARLTCDAAAGSRLATRNVGDFLPCIADPWRVILTVMGPRGAETRAFQVTDLPARLRLAAIGDPNTAVGFEAVRVGDGGV